MARSSSGESVLQRVVRILAAFDPDSPTLSVSQISSRARLPISTTSRLVEEMVGQGLLHREEDRRIGIGVRLWELAQRASPTLGLREAALPFMEDLHAVVGQHIQLGVLQNDQVLFVERLSAPDAVVNLTRIAGRLSLHASSSGLVLLAHAPADLQERVIHGSLPAYTDHTPTTPGALRAVLARVRTEGFVLCPGFIHPDATGIAVPVRDPHNRVIAALSVVVPNDERSRMHVPALRSAARGVQRHLAATALDSAHHDPP